jgi:hypothetical protein
MTQLEISTVLQMIEEWIAQLPEAKLGEQCRRSGIDFFSYMTGRGVDAGYLAKLITDSTGYNPRQLWTVQDADLLKDAIFRYEGSVEAAKQGDDPEKTAKYFWG